MEKNYSFNGITLEINFEWTVMIVYSNGDTYKVIHNPKSISFHPYEVLIMTEDGNAEMVPCMVSKYGIMQRIERGNTNDPLVLVLSNN